MNYYELYKKEIEIIKIKECKPKLLLHVCCAPCNSSVLEKIANIFDVTVFFYNPNISPESEYTKRIIEEKRFLKEYPFNYNINIIECEYNENEFLEIAKGLESEPEKGPRCYKCYKLRLEKTAEYAKNNSFDYFSTTLSVSPHKNSTWLNEIGDELSKKYDIKYLYSDFKKEDGYKRSIELSKEYNLYRQDYCGCKFSKKNKDETL